MASSPEELNLITEGTQLKGQLVFDQNTQVYGTLLGEVIAKPGSILTVNEPGLIEGNIQADTLIIEGYVQGDIVASTQIVISKTGRVVGNLTTASLALEFGAYFEGHCTMNCVQ